MEETDLNTDLSINGDPHDAKRMAETFVEVYQVTLIRIEQHLDDVIEEAGAQYAEGYKPWQQAVHDLVHGTFLLSKENVKPDKDTLSDALRVFSFESSVKFLDDLATSIGIRTERGWHERFRQHIHVLMSAMDIMPKKRPLISAPSYEAAPSSA
jgi:hypothetical protein